MDPRQSLPLSEMKPLSFFADDDSRWAAVQSRDAIADGFFVYGVRTTKIYCRPICKARLARRANVRFYSTGNEAQNAGFRACKRCKPELDGFMPEEKAVQQIRKFVRDEAANAGDGERQMSLSQMAKKTGLSKWHFHRVFKRCVGVTPFEYLKTERAAWADGPAWSNDMIDLALLRDWSTDSASVGSGWTASDASPVSLDDWLVWPEDP